MNKIILHIPHSSKKLRKEFWKNTILNKEKIIKFVNDICDEKTDIVFGKNNYKTIKAKYSRVYCDVEKFSNDNQEIMAKFGQGVVYTKTNLGETFNNPSPEYRQKVLKYYYKYHNKIDKVSQTKVKTKQDVVLIDCHSFSSNIIMFEEKKKNLPDICLGVNEIYNEKLLNFVENYFASLGYNVKINYPYEGSLIPNCFLENKPSNFHSIMIELNKEMYLNNIKTVQKQINQMLNKLEHLNLC